MHLNFVWVPWTKLRRKQVELSSYFAHLENSAIVKTGTTRALAKNRQLGMELIKISPRVNTRISFLGTGLIMELGIVLAFFRAQWNSFECLFREVIKEVEANDAQFWLLCAIHSLLVARPGRFFHATSLLLSFRPRTPPLFTRQLKYYIFDKRKYVDAATAATAAATNDRMQPACSK